MHNLKHSNGQKIDNIDFNPIIIRHGYAIIITNIKRVSVNHILTTRTSIKNKHASGEKH